MKYLGTRISENITRDSVGQLICENCIISRDGPQRYMRSELPGWDPKTMTDEVIMIDRPWKEVSKPETIASFEAKPVVVRHPIEDVSVHNYRDVVVGYSKDVRPGTKKVDGYNVLLATLVIYEPEAIEAVESGRLRELSCGYDVDIDMDLKMQYAIEGNHIAIVDSGRGQITTIRDSGETVEPEVLGSEGQSEVKIRDYSGHQIREVLEAYGIGDYTIEPDADDPDAENVILFKPVDSGTFSNLQHKLKLIHPTLSLYGIMKLFQYQIVAKSDEMERMISEHRGGVKDATPKQPRHSIITLPENNVFEFDNVRELDKLLTEHELVGIVELIFEGEAVDDITELPKSYQDVLVKHNWGSGSEDISVEDSAELWKVVLKTTESNDPDEVPEDVVIHFGPDDAQELSDVLEGINFDEAEVHTLDEKEITINDLPEPIQVVLKKYLP